MFKDDIEFKTELKKHKDEKLVSKRIRKYRPRGGGVGGGGVVSQGVTLRIERFPVQVRLRVPLGLGTQPCYKAQGNLWVQINIRNAVINIGLVRLSP